ncbi:MAG: molybdenum ABC transporter ATP-binding protein [Wenzhouxiangella sp.]|nr:MAG: molybdenum ABC transporter ATP-binding protein [Wenzhouxiangella sp.]
MTLSVAVRWRREGDFVLDVNIDLPPSGVTALFGRSGCGKTSLLRIIAGLERIGGAQVQFRGQCWQEGRHFVPLHRRRTGLVFQEHSLLPHLSVRGNLVYGYRRTPPRRRRHHPDAVTEMLGIGSLLDRPVDRLSGGQRQRVALGRALLSSPQLLLLDEPMAALDTQTRREIMPFFSELAGQADVPIILVTHSPDEVQRLADRVVFLDEGRVTRIESLKQALSHPDSPLFFDQGAASVLTGRILPDREDGMLRFGNDRLQLLMQADRPAAQAGITRLSIQANDVAISRQALDGISVINQLPMVIEKIEAFRPGRVLVAGTLADGQRLSAEITERSCRQLALEGGQTVYALIKSVALLD